MGDYCISLWDDYEFIWSFIQMIKHKNLLAFIISFIQIENSPSQYGKKQRNDVSSYQRTPQFTATTLTILKVVRACR